MTIKNIFVIGAGTMGNGIAQVAATSGYDVTCMDAVSYTHLTLPTSDLV